MSSSDKGIARVTVEEQDRGSTSESTDPRPSGSPGRGPDGRWLPGGPSPNPQGRSPKVREVEIHEASARGCSAGEWEKVVAKLVELALAGDVPAARLLAQVRGAIGTEPVRELDVVPELVLDGDPARAARVEELLAAVFEGRASS